jgi:hypothetical protein
VVEAECQTERHQQSHHPTEDHRPTKVRAERRSGNRGPLDDANVIAAAVGKYLQFFFSTKERLVQLAITLGIALEYGVGHALAIEICSEILLLVQRARERPLLEHRRLVIVSDRIHGLRQFQPQRAIGIVKRRIDREDLWMLVAVSLGQQRPAALELRDLRLQRLDVRVLQDAGNGIWSR